MKYSSSGWRIARLMISARCSLTLMRTWRVPIVFRHWSFFGSRARRWSWTLRHIDIVVRHIDIFVFVLLASNVLNLNRSPLRRTFHLNFGDERCRCGWPWASNGWWASGLRIGHDVQATNWRDLLSRVATRTSGLGCLRSIAARQRMHSSHMLSFTGCCSKGAIAPRSVAEKHYGWYWTRRMCIANTYIIRTVHRNCVKRE